MRGKYTVMADKPKEFFNLIPQTGVTHLMCREDPDHNAIWDMAVSPEGKIFFSEEKTDFIELSGAAYDNKKIV
jgi:hypothetical protein